PDQRARLALQLFPILPKDLALSLLDDTPALPVHEFPQGSPDQRRPLAAGMGGVQLVEELEGRFVNSHRNSLHIGDSITFYGHPRQSLPSFVRTRRNEAARRPRKEQRMVCRLRVILTLALILVLGAALGAATDAGAQAKPEGEMRWALYVTIAPAWFDPAEVVGVITP